MIINRLTEIEAENKIRILYACESGSRIWGFESKDSDWDVRFLYVRTPEWYLSLERLYHIRDAPDTIRYPIDDNLIDLEGWDITKAILALYKSNCPLHEWLQSSIKYVSNPVFVETMIGKSTAAWSVKKAMYHYFSMTENNIKEYLIDRKEVWSKKYLYIIRTLLAGLYIEKHQCMPPPSINALLISAQPRFDIYEEVVHLLKRKIRGDELGKELFNIKLNDYIFSEMNRLRTGVIPLLGDQEYSDLLPSLNSLMMYYIVGGK